MLKALPTRWNKIHYLYFFSLKFFFVIKKIEIWIKRHIINVLFSRAMKNNKPTYNYIIISINLTIENLRKIFWRWFRVGEKGTQYSPLFFRPIPDRRWVRRFTITHKARLRTIKQYRVRETFGGALLQILFSLLFLLLLFFFSIFFISKQNERVDRPSIYTRETICEEFICEKFQYSSRFNADFNIKYQCRI